MDENKYYETCRIITSQVITVEWSFLITCQNHPLSTPNFLPTLQKFTYDKKHIIINLSLCLIAGLFLSNSLFVTLQNYRVVTKFAPDPHTSV